MKDKDTQASGGRIYREGVINKSLTPVDECEANELIDLLKENIKQVELRGY